MVGFRKGVLSQVVLSLLKRKKFADGLNDVCLVLIDGVDLAELMIERCVRVHVRETTRVTKIDQDFFSLMNESIKDLKIFVFLFKI